MSPLLEVSDLAIRTRDAPADALLVRGVSFGVQAGQTLAIVGESGSGKTLSTMAVAGLLPQGLVVTGGSIRFEGREIASGGDRSWLQMRGRRIGVVFQDPMTSLNPALRIETQMCEASIHHEKLSRADARERAVATFKEVGIDRPEARLSQYPHELSGGLRQRVMIAMALMCSPSLLIADEPTTALDVTVQKQVLELIRHLNRSRGLAVLFVSHNLGAVAEVAESVLVMRNGEIVEHGDTATVLRAPQHLYTRKLVDSLPRLPEAL